MMLTHWQMVVKDYDNYKIMPEFSDSESEKRKDENDISESYEDFSTNVQ